MKLETLMLRTLFFIGLLICGLVLGAMLDASPQAVRLASTGGIGSLLPSAPSACMLPPDDVICTRPGR